MTKTVSSSRREPSSAPEVECPVEVIASATGYVNAWIDFDGDGAWSDSGEQALGDVIVSNGTNTVEISVPGTAVPGPTYGRFRFSTYPGLSFDGLALDGEVEDHVLFIEPPVVVTSMVIDVTGRVSLDWNDCPGYLFTVEWCPDLLSTWAPVPGTPWPIRTNSWTIADPPTNRTFFYRVRAD